MVDSLGVLVGVSSVCSFMISSKDPSNSNNLLPSNRPPSVSLNAVTFSKNESVKNIKWLGNH